jgi:hypothetical protein
MGFCQRTSASVSLASGLVDEVVLISMAAKETISASLTRTLCMSTVLRVTVRPGLQAAGEATGALKGYPRNLKRKAVHAALVLHWKLPVVFSKSDSTNLNVKMTLVSK